MTRRDKIVEYFYHIKSTLHAVIDISVLSDYDLATKKSTSSGSIQKLCYHLSGAKLNCFKGNV